MLGQRERIQESVTHEAVAVDIWHLVALANQMVTEIRQRATRDQLARRGTSRDLIWVNRPLLLTGAAHLSRKQADWLWRSFDVCDPTKQIQAAWAAASAKAATSSSTSTENKSVRAGSRAPSR